MIMKIVPKKIKYVALALCILLIGNAATTAASQRIRSATQMRQCRRLLNIDKVVPMPQRTK